MSYQVLARKWRPQTFSELVGQQHVVDAITNALENDKLHHAYLFTGTRGVGKTTIARIFSKSLNCEQGQSANPCGKCDTCVDISDGRYVDLLEIDAASRTKVEDTRELLDNVQYRPTRGKYKVYLIDEVHMLSKHSFNALLKTLEEPPEHVKFLLATTDPQKLPVTVLSRCLQFSLKALTTDQIRDHLAYILGQEQIQYEQSAIVQLARAAQGSIRDSLSLTDQAIAQGNNQVSLAVVANMLGLLNKNQIVKLVKYICERDSLKALSQLDDICSQSPDYFQVISQLLGLLHQIALTQVVPEVCKLDSDSAKGIYTIANSISKEHIQILYQIGINGKRDLPHAPDAKTGLEMTILRMLAFSPAQTVDLDVDSLVVTSNNLPQFETLPEVASSLVSAAAVEVKSESQQNLTSESPRGISQISHPDNKAEQSLAKAGQAQEELANKTEPNHKHADEHSSIATNKDPQRPPDFDEEQPPLPDEEPPMYNDMFADEFDIGSTSHQSEDGPESNAKSANRNEPHHNSSSDSLKAKQPLAQNTQKPQPTQSESPQLDNDSSKTFNLLKVSKQLKQYTKEKEGDSGVKKSEADTQTAEAVEGPFVYKLGHTFVAFDGTLPAFLDNGEKVISASQLDEWSAFVDATDIQALTRQLLINASCTALSNPLVLTLANENQSIHEEPIVEKIQATLSDLLGQELDVRIKFGEVNNTPFEIQTSINDMRLRHAFKVIDTEQSIQELIKAFNAKVVDGSVEAR
jgi:DNA polymerase-3 subunit gamma/tau